MVHNEFDPDVQRVRYEVRRFRQHFITYIAVIGVLFVVNALTGGFWFGHWWFFWIALIWGVILALEAAHLFGEDIGREWEDRMVDQVVARRRRQGPATPGGVYTPPPPPSPPAGPSIHSGPQPAASAPAAPVEPAPAAVPEVGSPPEAGPPDLAPSPPLPET